MTLEEAVIDAMEAGVTDPVDVAEFIAGKYDAHWMRKAVEPYHREVIRNVVRQLYQARRRHDGAYSDEHKDREAIPRRIFCGPEVGWRDEAEMTADEYDAASLYYANQAIALSGKADLYAERARVMREAGVKRYGDIVLEVAA